MRQKILLTLSMVLLLIAYNAFAKNFESFKFISQEKPEYHLTMYGPFSGPEIVGPNDIIFTYGGKNIEYANDIIFMFSDSYKMIGRTGEKTFEIEHFQKFPSSKITKKEILKIYFEENVAFPIKVLKMYSGCPNDEEVKIKMLELSGPYLKFQVILPDCLKSKIDIDSAK